MFRLLPVWARVLWIQHLARRYPLAWEQVKEALRRGR